MTFLYISSILIFLKEFYMGLGRMALLWILGIPLGVIIILKVLGVI